MSLLRSLQSPGHPGSLAYTRSGGPPTYAINSRRPGTVATGQPAPRTGTISDVANAACVCPAAYRLWTLFCQSPVHNCLALCIYSMQMSGRSSNCTSPPRLPEYMTHRLAERRTGSEKKHPQRPSPGRLPPESVLCSHTSGVPLSRWQVLPESVLSRSETFATSAASSGLPIVPLFAET
jgi:hypothetical protein